MLSLADGVPPARPGWRAPSSASSAAWWRTAAPGLVVGWLLLVVGVTLTLSSFCLDWARHALVVDPGSLPAGEAASGWGPGCGSWATARWQRCSPATARWGATHRSVAVAWRASLGVTALAAAGWALTPYDELDRPPLDGLDPSVVSPDGHGAGAHSARGVLPAARVCSLAG